MKKLSIVLFLSIALSSVAQDVHFSQFKASSFLLNPALVGAQNNDYKATLQRKSQWASVSIPFNTLAFSLERKDIIPSHSIGVQFLSDIAGDSRFKTTGINLGYAKKVAVTAENLFSFGAQLGIFQRSIEFDDLVFNDPENFSNLNFIFPDVAIGIANFPSDNAMYDASTPSILSSIMILFPASPNFLLTNIISIAFSASVLLLQTITPFPAAKPSAFMTTSCSIPLTYSFAFEASSNTSNAAVEILFRFINSFAQILLDSNCAAFFVGPNIFKPFSLNTSTIPAASGASGPTIVKQSFSEANMDNASKSSTEIGTLFDVPPFPGA